MLKKILVVDDEPDMLTLLDARLSGCGFEVLEAASGPKGVQVARREHPDLILLDIVMPGQDGIETYHQLKANPQTQGIPVIFLTAAAQGLFPDQPKSDPRGRYLIIGKPFRPEDLIQAIREAAESPGVEQEEDGGFARRILGILKRIGQG